MLKYVNINNLARKELEISYLEYVICDMVYHLSANPTSPTPGWCSMSQKNMSKEIDITDRGLRKIISRLIEKDLVIKNKKGHLKSTQKWYETVILYDRNKVPTQPEQSSYPMRNKVPTISNIDINIDKEERKAPSSKIPNVPLIELKNIDAYSALNTKSKQDENTNAVNVATLIETDTEYVRRIYGRFLFAFGIEPNRKLENVAMRIDHREWKVIDEHLPGYFERTTIKNESGKKFRATGLNYLKNQLWLNDPNPKTDNPTQIPTTNKITQIPKS